jgi:MFS family permease
MRNQLLSFVWGLFAIGWGVGAWVSGGFYYGKGPGRTFVTAAFHPGIFWGGIATAIIIGAFVLCIGLVRSFPAWDGRSHRPGALQGKTVPMIDRVVLYAGFGLFILTLLLAEYMKSEGRKHRSAEAFCSAPIVLGLTMLAGVYINWRYIGFPATKKGYLNYRLELAFMALFAAGTVAFGVASLLSHAGEAPDTSW